MHVEAPGRRERLPAHTPLRTVRESFPSHGSSLSKDAPVEGIPAIIGSNVSIQAIFYAGATALASRFFTSLRPRTGALRVWATCPKDMTPLIGWHVEILVSLWLW